MSTNLQSIVNGIFTPGQPTTNVTHANFTNPYADLQSTLNGINDKLGTASKFQGAGAIMGGIAGLVNAGTGIYGAITNAENAKKQLALAKENFEFQKGLANRNLTNQAKAYNQEVGARSALAAAYDRGNANAQADYYDRWRVSEAGVNQAENYKNPYRQQ